MKTQFKNYVIERNKSEVFGKDLNILNIIACKPTLAEAQKEHALICNVNNDCKYANIRGYEDDTELEAFIMFKSGMSLLTRQQFLNQIDHLGYKVNSDLSFNYFNSGNERKYKALSLYIVEKDSGLSFANNEARRDNNFKLLQEMRQTCFCYEAGRIWEF